VLLALDVDAEHHQENVLVDVDAIDHDGDGVDAV
jgi:hypothetical protein